MLLVVIFLSILFYGSILAKENSFSTIQLETFHKSFKKHSILALGDSLTTGLFLTRHNLGHHPYTEELRRLINSTDIKVLDHGVNGDTTSRMVHRLQRVLDHHRNLKFAIILGGTNDLIHQESPEVALKNLISMHHSVHELLGVTNAISTIAIGVPHIKDGDDGARDKINKGLQEYAQKCSHLVRYHDLEVEFNKSIAENHILWSDDGVHFSESGSNKLGSLLFADLVDIANKGPSTNESNVMC